MKDEYREDAMKNSGISKPRNAGKHKREARTNSLMKDERKIEYVIETLEKSENIFSLGDAMNME